jgi:thiol-disulfide isomerase/thioredoxin
MSLTPSTMMPIGTEAPDFSLPDTVSGRSMSLGDFADAKALAVMFICNHCPYVKHLADQLAALGRDYADRGVGFVAICSNDVANYPDDRPELMAAEAKARGYTFPYLYDESQDVAQGYTAACTPDFFLFDGEKKLFYRGQLDDSRPGNDAPVTGADFRAALDALLAGESAPAEQKPSVGCNIKWKAGNEPSYG